MIGFSADDYTFAQLIYAVKEKEIAMWNHTSALMAMLHNSNVSKKSETKGTLDFHPWGKEMKKEQKKHKANRAAKMSQTQKEAEGTFAKIAFKAKGFSLGTKEKPAEKWFKLGEIHGDEKN